jgi:hypothetical protein
MNIIDKLKKIYPSVEDLASPTYTIKRIPFDDVVLDRSGERPLVETIRDYTQSRLKEHGLDHIDVHRSVSNNKFTCIKYFLSLNTYLKISGKYYQDIMYFDDWGSSCRIISTPPL